MPQILTSPSPNKFFLVICFFCCQFSGIGQIDSLSVSSLIDIRQKLCAKIERLSAKQQQKLEGKTDKWLRRVQKEEIHFISQVKLKDSVLAAYLTNSGKNIFDLKSDSNSSALSANYAPLLDSQRVLLKYISQMHIADTSMTHMKMLSKAKLSIDKLSRTMDDKTRISNLLKERVTLIKDRLKVLPALDIVKKYEKQIYYYRQQVDDIKATISEPEKLERVALEIANKIPAFQAFFKRNSQLASLTNEGDNPMDLVQSSSLMQTSAVVRQQLQQKFGEDFIGKAGNVKQALQEKIQQGQTQIGQLKPQALRNIANGYKPIKKDSSFIGNSQKTKGFWQRIEFGFDMQPAKRNNSSPVTNDIAIKAAYKLNDKSLIGAGIVYKLGLGDGIEKLSITHEGMGYRTFVDVKFKGNIWLTGAYEMAYNSRFARLDIFRTYNHWERSALFGVTKKILLTNKKKYTVQILYDFLNSQHTITGSPWKFRAGWSF